VVTLTGSTNDSTFIHAFANQFIRRDFWVVTGGGVKRHLRREGNSTGNGGGAHGFWAVGCLASRPNTPPASEEPSKVVKVRQTHNFPLFIFIFLFSF
jgi:hypothetical protein